MNDWELKCNMGGEQTTGQECEWEMFNGVQAALICLASLFSLTRFSMKTVHLALRWCVHVRQMWVHLDRQTENILERINWELKRHFLHLMKSKTDQEKAMLSYFCPISALAPCKAPLHHHKCVGYENSAYITNIHIAASLGLVWGCEPLIHAGEAVRCCTHKWITWIRICNISWIYS